MTKPSARLEIGHNIFELIEFSLVRHLEDGSTIEGVYGVNVVKVREVIRMPKINKLSSNIPGVAGVFELRGVPIPVINLALALGDKEAPVSEDQQIIVTEFSRKRAGFIVSSTHKIRRIAWEKVLPPASDAGTCINGMTLIENNDFLFILDLERVLLDIEGKAAEFSQNSSAMKNMLQRFGGNIPQAPDTPLVQQNNIQATPVAHQPAQSNNSKGTLLLVDDSSIILSSVQKALQASGYKVHTATNGHEAKSFLQNMIDNPTSACKVDAVVTDVEMPRMDGLTLTKWIKQESPLASMPVIMHTSLSGSANQEAGYSVGANGYVVKNDIRYLLHFLGEILGGNAKVEQSA